MTFSELGIQQEICSAVEELGFEHPMPIQEAVIPKLVESLKLKVESKDLIALAQTGTGKTAAFGLPLLQIHRRWCSRPLVNCACR